MIAGRGRPEGARPILVFNSLPFFGRGHSEPCYRICEQWQAQGQPVEIYTTVVVRPDSAGVLRALVPKSLPRRLQSYAAAFRYRPALRYLNERRALPKIGPGTVCYFWPDASLHAMRQARDRGATVVTEFINTHVAHARDILEQEHRRIGAPPPAHITDAMIEAEERRLELADAVFTPGPFVAASIRERSRHTPRLLQTSYGVDLPGGYPFPAGAPSGRPVRFLFVGSVDIRKGAHVLIEAWRRAGIEGELQFVGVPEPFIAENWLDRGIPGISRLGYQPDLTPVYRDADVFVFPSLEEGDPQVTYLAAAHGLPLVVTPMGGATIARDRQNALIVPPSDPDALAAAMREIALDTDLRLRLARRASADAAEFTWAKVAARRLDALASIDRSGGNARSAQPSGMKRGRGSSRLTRTS